MRIGLEDIGVLKRCKGLFFGSMKYPTYPTSIATRIANSTDHVRFASLALALQTIEREGIPGAVAELGVWRGNTSSFIHSQAPKRMLYLFDTFEGFPGEESGDRRFQDTSLELVRRKIGDCSNVIFKAGTFPETAGGLESERFALVMIDVDKYGPTLAGLNFFYSRVARGGYIFLHDYNSQESDHGVSRAVGEFMKGRPELLIEIPDVWGSVVFRKI
jgi:O-methyltransferase